MSAVTNSPRYLDLMKAFRNGVFHEDLEGIEKPADVQHTDRLAVDAQLRPGNDFEEFLQGAEASRQGDEGVGQRRHERLALVHAGDDVQPGHRFEREFPFRQRLGNDAVNRAAGLHHRVGDGAHQADVPAAVHQPVSARCQQLAQLDCRLPVARVGAALRTAKHADVAHVVNAFFSVS